VVLGKPSGICWLVFIAQVLIIVCPLLLVCVVAELRLGGVAWSWHNLPPASRSAAAVIQQASGPCGQDIGVIGQARPSKCRWVARGPAELDLPLPGSVGEVVRRVWRRQLFSYPDRFAGL